VAALAGSAAALAVSAGGATVAKAVSPERDAIRALIDEAEPRLAASAKALKRASERHSSKLQPTASSRSAMTRAIAKQVAELRALFERVTSSPVTTQRSREAQRLVLDTIQLTVDYLTKLNEAVHAKSKRGTLRSLRASRKALDNSLQRGINAQEALTSQ
jgi:exonuclease VII large subunit